MQVRDAVEADAAAMAALAEQPEDVMRNLVHDRTVRVAVEADAPDPDASDGLPPEALRGVVSFDARDGAVHVTQLAGDAAAVERVLAEPLRFARREGMAAEALIEAGDDATRGAAEAAGFEEVGSGPLFEGERTVRYRAEPS